MNSQRVESDEAAINLEAGFRRVLPSEAAQRGVMAQWVPVGDDFIAADVIRWKEGVFKSRRSKKGKAIRLGERLVIAEVLRDQDGWVSLLVRSCDVMTAATGKNVSDVPVLPKNAEMKRKRTTITRGNAERLMWSDESARALLASRFLGNR